MTSCIASMLIGSLIAGSLEAGIRQDAEPGRFEKGGAITLRIDYYRGPGCELTVEFYVQAATQGRTSVALSCGQAKAHRWLTANEADDFLRLARDSQLYRARGVGADLRGADLWFATIEVIDSGRIVVLVVSGNSEFANGPPRDLVAFLEKLLTELRPRLTVITGK